MQSNPARGRGQPSPVRNARHSVRHWCIQHARLPEMTALTADHDTAADARRVFDAVAAGGVAIIPLDVAYAVLAHSPAAVQRIYDAKQRNASKATGIVGTAALHREVHRLPTREFEMVRRITQDHGLPLAVIAEYRSDHPLLRRMDPFVLERATHDGTLNMLLNAGELRTRIAELSIERGVPLVGTSANVSLTGSKYRLQDVEAPLRAIADVEIDYGLARYHNPQGLSSTMIDFRTMRVTRAGVCYDAIAAVLLHEFGVELVRPAASARSAP